MKYFNVMIGLLLLFSVVGCKTTLPIIEIPVEPPHLAAQILTIDTVPDENEFRMVRIRFSENTKYDVLIQEIYMDTGEILVECFDTPNGTFSYGWDQHSWRTNSTHRRMRVYPGSVEGVDRMNGFAQLPQNRLGTAVTNIGPYFNARYQWNYGPNGEDPDPIYGVNHRTTGRIIEDDRENSMWWEITCIDGVIEVLLPDGNKITIGNTVQAKGK